MENIKNFCELTRAYSLPMIIATLCVILSYAHYSQNFTIFNFILLVIALCVLHLGANLFDDYIDIKNKQKEGFELNNINFANERKAILIRNGVFSLEKVQLILCIMFASVCTIGLYFTIVAGWQILIFALLGAGLILFYPFSAKYYLSEIVVGLAFGPVAIMGGYFALTGGFDSNLLLLSSTIFITTIILLHTHSIMDWEFDIKEGKNTLALLCKTKPRAIVMLKWMIIISYTIIVFGIFNLNFNPNMMYVFLTLPIATKLQKSIKDYINIKDVKFIPRWYYGPFENWDKIKENKIDFFMYRFYLARNFALFFAIFASIGAVL